MATSAIAWVYGLFMLFNGSYGNVRWTVCNAIKNWSFFRFPLSRLSTQIQHIVAMSIIKERPKFKSTTIDFFPDSFSSQIFQFFILLLSLEAWSYVYGIYAIHRTANPINSGMCCHSRIFFQFDRFVFSIPVYNNRFLVRQKLIWPHICISYSYYLFQFHCNNEVDVGFGFRLDSKFKPFFMHHRSCLVVFFFHFLPNFSSKFFCSTIFP